MKSRTAPRWICAVVVVALGLLSTASTAARLEKAEADQFLEHVKVLASPDMKGRGAGMPELDRAADYIAGEFRKLGLEAAGDQDSYLQPLKVTTGARMGERNEFVVCNESGEQRLKPGKDYLPFNFSSGGSVSGEVVFAGYGVSADEFGYDDYTHFDVQDKIVVLLRYEPKSFGKNPGSMDARRTHHAQFISKAINARNRGAKAVLLVNGKIPRKKKDKLLKFGSVAGPDDAGILMLHVKNAVVDEWLRAGGKSLADLQTQIDEKQTPQSFALPESMTISIDVEIERKQAHVNNVAAYLPGESDEYIVVGAHYDHLGLGDQSSLAPSQIGTVHHGADDNASGTAGMLELARIFSQRPQPLPRGILFLAFAGEEIGLLGSAYWVDHPTLPIDKAVAMINMDMIGRIDESKVYSGGIGTGSTFKTLLEKAAADHDLEIDQAQSGYSASDHTSFVGKKIPVLFFFSGLHGDYHKPSDTWDKINAQGAARLLDLVADISDELLLAEQRPKFVKVEGPAHGGRASSGGGRGYGPYFGSVPDFAKVETGVKFADIRPGSPADKAGLQPGDILVQFGDQPIKNLYDFTYALRASAVGDVVEVTVLREGNETTAQVTLEERP